MTPQTNTTNTPTPKATRQPGFYWVRKGEKWEVVEWSGVKWVIHGVGWMLDTFWVEIDERLLTREQATEKPYEQMDRDERSHYWRQKRRAERAKEEEERAKERAEKRKCFEEIIRRLFF